MDFRTEKTLTAKGNIFSFTQEAHQVDRLRVDITNWGDKNCRTTTY
jgi:hypothetical protein